MNLLYSEKKTYLHKIQALIKLIILFILSLVIYQIENPIFLILNFLVCLGFYFSLGKINFNNKNINRLLFTIIFSTFLIAVFHLIQKNYYQSLVIPLRLISLSFLGIILIITTHPNDLILVLEKILSPLKAFGISNELIALQFNLVFRFIEYFFIKWQKLSDNYYLKTGKNRSLILIIPLIIQTLLTAQKTSEALYLRLRKRN